MPNVVVVGLQWGDEGKGKVVDIYTKFADMVVRFQGGSNAGHTIIVDDVKTVLHLLPSGILHQNKTCVIGSGVTVDPDILWQEIEAVRQAGHLGDEALLRISYEAAVISRYHKALDDASEQAMGNRKIGTTKRGIGPSYEERVARRGIRIKDLLSRKTLKEKLQHNLEYANFLLKEYYHTETFNVDEELDYLCEFGTKLKPFMEDTALLVYREIKRGRNVLFEGAQGTMLDLDYGTYPYVTSSNTIAGAASTGTGIGPGMIDRVLGIVKAYTTRVGMGPFPTELEDEVGQRLRDIGKEYGATTGRPRRCGWLDVVLMRYALRLNGVTNLALTKLDVLTGLPKIKICTGYKYRSKIYDEYPYSDTVFKNCEPVYEELPGWNEPIGEIREFDELPATAKRYIRRIEDLAGIKFSFVSVGPKRGDSLVLRNPFRE